MSFEFSDRSIRNMNGIHKKMILIAHDALAISKYDFGIPNQGGLRTAMQQNVLFSKGLSNADGYMKKSKHQDGLALDYYGWVDGKATWDMEVCAHIGAAFLQAAIRNEVKVQWSGFWKSIDDYCHIEFI